MPPRHLCTTCLEHMLPRHACTTSLEHMLQRHACTTSLEHMLQRHDCTTLGTSLRTTADVFSDPCPNWPVRSGQRELKQPNFITWANLLTNGDACRTSLRLQLTVTKQAIQLPAAPTRCQPSLNTARRSFHTPLFTLQSKLSWEAHTTFMTPQHVRLVTRNV